MQGVAETQPHCQVVLVIHGYTHPNMLLGAAKQYNSTGCTHTDKYCGWTFVNYLFYCFSNQNEITRS